MVLRKLSVYRISFRRLLTIFLVITLQAGNGFLVASDLQTLQISVIQTSTLAEARELLRASPDTADGLVTSQRPPARIWGTGFRRQPGNFQQVRVLEGSTAFVSVGRRKPEVRLLWVEETGHGPVPNIGFSSRESSTGFFVKAELNEGEVVLHLERYSNQSQHEHDFRTVRTAITGLPGEWLDVGGVMDLPGHRPDSRVYSLDHPDEGQFRVFVRVEMAP